MYFGGHGEVIIERWPSLATTERWLNCDIQCSVIMYTFRSTLEMFAFYCYCQFFSLLIFFTQLLFKAFCFICLQLSSTEENLRKCLVCFDLLSGCVSRQKQQISTLITWMKTTTWYTRTSVNFAHTIYSAAHCIQTMNMKEVKVFPSGINYFSVNSYSATDESHVARNET